MSTPILTPKQIQKKMDQLDRLRNELIEKVDPEIVSLVTQIINLELEIEAECEQ